MPAVFNDQIFDYVSTVARVDADTADVYAAGFAGVLLVELENVSAFEQNNFAHRTVHGPGHFGMQLELPVFAMNGDKIFWLYQIDDQLQFLLAGMSANMHWRGSAVFVYHVCLAPEEVIDHAVNRLLVAGNDSRRKHDCVALLDLGVFVVVYCGAR